MGVPCGSRCAKDIFVLLRNPVKTAPAHRGMAIPTFIESCVVGVNEWGNIPRRLVEAINRNNEISIRDQVCPLGLCALISCFDVSLVNHCWIEIVRLLISRFGVGNKMDGRIIIRVVIGIPTITGVMKGANRFSFMWCLKGFVVFVFWLVLIWGWGSGSVLKFLVEVIQIGLGV